VDCEGLQDFTPCYVATSPDRSYDICISGVCRSPGCGEVSCVEGRFTRDDATDALEPVVVDNVTGLVWQGCAMGLTGSACGSGAVESMTWNDALAECDSLEWGGHDDWRLPSHAELHSLVDVGFADGVVHDAFSKASARSARCVR
jgi:hypothetical protein